MELKNEALKKDAEFCEHMREFVALAREKRVYFGGCGDCGSPWLECKTCDKSVDLADQVFSDYHGGYST